MTGERGVGKSTVCLRATQRARMRGFTCTGLITLRGPSGSRDVLDVYTGALHRLTVPSDVPDPQFAEHAIVVQGDYRFQSEVLLWGNSVFVQAVPTDVLIVDEIGPLEVERKLGWTNAFAALCSGQYRLALVVVRPELAAAVRSRLLDCKVETITVTPSNRDELPDRFIAILESMDYAHV